MNCESYQTDNGNMQISYFGCDKKQNKKIRFQIILKEPGKIRKH